MESANFVDICPVCKQGVSKTDMDFQKGKVFHAQCFTEHGSSFPTPDDELAYLSAKTRIELVLMKNLKVRTELGELKLPKSPIEKVKKPVKKSRTKKNRMKSKSRGSRKIKARKSKSKVAKTKKRR